MSGRSEHDVPWDDDFWEVSHAAARLTQYACEVAVRCLDDGMLRLQFTQEMAYVGKGIVEDVRRGEKTPQEGLNAIRKEQQALQKGLSEYLRLVAGLAGGIAQIATGLAVCKYSVGIACGTLGMALFQHGLNSVYENGRNILERRTDTVGPLRRGYQQIAKAMNGKDKHGNIAYGVTDIGLSVYGLSRWVVGPGAWKLYSYLKADHVMAYKTMGKDAIALDLGVDVLTGELIWVEWNKE